MVQVSKRDSKLSPKFLGLRHVIQKLDGHKFVVWDPVSQTSETVHADRLKPTRAVPDDSGVTPPHSDLHTGAVPDGSNATLTDLQNDVTSVSSNSRPYNFRPRK